MGAVQRQVYNDELMNFANYNSLQILKALLNNFYKLEELACSGDTVAASIYIDLKTALESDGLTDYQRICIKYRFLYRETNQHIADSLNLKSENSVRKHVEGGLKRMRRILNGGALYANRSRRGA